MHPTWRWWPLVAISLGTFMLLVDVTIVNVALPSIATSLGSSFTDLQWVIDGYALALAALLLLAGGLADRFGRRRVYLVGLAVFSLGSLACGLAPGAGTLIAARVVQGAGGAAMFATTAALLATTYSGRDRGVAFGVWGAVNGLAAASGPLLGGLLTEGLGWPAIFLVNLPVAVAAVGLTLRVVTESASGSGRIDAAGASAFTVAVVGLVVGLIAGGDRGWTDPTTLASLGVAVVATGVFVAVERRVARPMLDLALFGRPSFSALMVGAALLSAAAFADLAYVSIWLQSVLGLGPIAAGLVVLPLSVAAFVVSAVAGRFLHGDDAHRPIAGGLALVGVGTLLMTLVDPTSGASALLLGVVVSGLGVGLATPVLVSAALAAVPPRLAGTASAAVNTFRQLGLALGIAVLGTLFAGRIGSVVVGAGLPGSVTDALTGGQASRVLAATPPAARPALDAVFHTAFAAGLDRIFVVAGLAALVAAVLVAVAGRPASATVEPEPAAA